MAEKIFWCAYCDEGVDQYDIDRDGCHNLCGGAVKEVSSLDTGDLIEQIADIEEENAWLHWEIEELRNQLSRARCGDG